MESFLLNLVEGVEGFHAYGLIFFILIICGLGIPIPEDISLILGGFLAQQQRATLWGMMVIGYMGIILGDSIVYWMGRRLGANVGRRPRKGFWGRLITPQRRAQVEQIFAKYGDRVIIVARFMPGLRAVTYFIAGSVRLKYSRFVFYDSIAALASAPLFVFLGWYFGGELEKLLQAIKEGKGWALWGVASLVVLWLGFKLWKAWRAKKTKPSG
ncbi:MAG: DedA family protein [Proteobacteria bacterium]|nr:DedA family protein [Pseudomonadota bacterium]